MSDRKGPPEARIDLTRTVRAEVTTYDGTVTVNDVPLPGIRELDLHAEVGRPPSLRLDLVLDEVRIGGEIVVTIPEDTAAALIALGWTPPPRD